MSGEIDKILLIKAREKSQTASQIQSLLHFYRRFCRQSKCAKGEETDEEALEEIMMSQTASYGKRLTNYLLDNIFISIFGIFIAFIVILILWIFIPSILEALESDSRLGYDLLYIIAGMIYYTTFEYTTGRTLAKYITKTKVVDKHGHKPNLKTIVLRSLCRYIPFEALTFLGASRQGLHDRLSKTRVIES